MMQFMTTGDFFDDVDLLMSVDFITIDDDACFGAFEPGQWRNHFV